MFSNLTIRTKLFMIALGIAAVMVLIGFLSYFYVNKVMELGQLTNDVNTFSNYVLEASRSESDFVSYDQTNPKFFELGTSKSIKKYNNYYNLSIDQIRYLRNNPTIQDYGLVPQLETIDKNFRSYKQTFIELQAVIKEKGYIGYGLIGRLRAAAKRIEGLIVDYSNPLLHKEMILTLRGYEKNFLVRKEMRYHKKFVRLIEAYRGSVAFADQSVEMSESQRAILLAAIDTYREVFETIVGRQQVIGLTLDEGLIGESKRIIAGIETNVNEIVQIIEKENEKAITVAIFTLLLFIVAIAIVIILALLLISKSITEPIGKIKEYVMELVQGKLPENVELNSQDEITEMANSLNIFVEGLRDKARFSQEIGKGTFDADFAPLSSADTLGNSLVEMRLSLSSAQDEREKRKIEDDKLNWANQGLAKFSEILRNNSGNVREFSTEIVEQLVNYVNANQGGIFIHDEHDEGAVLSLIASYAYDRRKYVQKTIPVGEGLIGACAVEKQRVYLTNLPDDYIEITSGLGDAPPNSLLIVPLIVETELMGILELASFNEIEEYKIVFIEKVGENIASSLRSAKISERTSSLLEKFQAQSEALAAQEQEMRENLHELRQTQEEAALKEQESRSFLDAINQTAIKANFSMDGIIVIANDLFLNTMGYSKEEIIGNHFSMFFGENSLDEFTQSWKQLLQSGRSFNHVLEYRARKRSVWMVATYSVLRDIEGKISGVLLLANDITEQKRKESELKGKYEKADITIAQMNDQLAELQKQIMDLRTGTDRYELEKSTIKTQLEEFKQKEQRLDLQLVKAKEEQELLKLKNRRLEFNETELKNKLDTSVKRIRDLEARALHMAYQYQYFERGLDLLPTPVIITNNDQEIVYLNGAAQGLIGQDIDAIGSHCSIWGSEACKGEKCAIKMLNKGKLGSSIEWGDRELDLEAFIIVDDSGEKIGHLELINDVTAIVNVENRVEQERKFFHDVIEKLPVNVAFKDANRNYIRVNQAMAQFLKLDSAEDAINKKSIDFFDVTEENIKEEEKILTTKRSVLNKLRKVNLLRGGSKWYRYSKMHLDVSLNGKPGLLEVSSDATDEQMNLELFKKIEKQKNDEITALKKELQDKQNAIGELENEINKLKGK